MDIREAVKKRKNDFEAEIQYASDMYAVVCRKLSWGLADPVNLKLLMSQYSTYVLLQDHHAEEMSQTVGAGYGPPAWRPR